MIHAYIHICLIYCKQGKERKRQTETEREGGGERERERERLCSPKPNKSGSTEESPMITVRVTTSGL